MLALSVSEIFISAFFLNMFLMLGQGRNSAFMSEVIFQVLIALSVVLGKV